MLSRLTLLIALRFDREAARAMTLSGPILNDTDAVRGLWVWMASEGRPV